MKRESTKEPVVPLHLSTYEGPGVSMLYPSGWKILKEPTGLIIAQSPTNLITIQWTKAVMNIEPTAEDRYRKDREIAQANVRALGEVYPQFEVLREYRLGDTPIFEYQYWDQKHDCLVNEQVMTFTDPETRRWVIAGWKIWGASTSTAYWGWCLRSRRARFDAVMQSISLKGDEMEQKKHALLSKYEGTWVSMMYPAGWDVEEKPRAVHISRSLRLIPPPSLISVTWREYGLNDFPPNLRAIWMGRTAEDRHRKNRADAIRDIRTMCGWRPRFEILREYALGDIPVFEYQFWVEETASTTAYLVNVQDASHTHPETCLYVRASWTVSGLRSTAEWDEEMDLRRALFDTVVQSITFK